MPLDPSIPLQVRPFEPQSPMGSIGALMQMRNLASEIQYRQIEGQRQAAMAATEQAQADQRNRDLADQKTIQDTLADPEKAKALYSGDTSPIDGRVQPTSAEKFRAAALDAQTKIAAHSKENQELWKSQHAAIADAGAGLLALEDDGKIQQAFPTTWGELTKAGIIPAGTPMPKVTGAADVKDLLAKNAALQGALEGASKLSESQQKVKTEIATAAKSQAEADLESFKLQAAKTAMQGGGIADPESAVETLIHQKDYPAAFQHAVANGKLAAAGADPTVLGAANKAFHDAVAKIYETEVLPALPETQRTKAAQALADLRATGPVRQAEIQQTAAINRAGQEHVTAQGEYEKSIQDLNTSSADALRLHNLIAAAQGGNKAAPGLVPIAELRAYLNRINSTELRSVSSQAGSLADRVEGWIKGKTEGQPIPPDILRATDELTGLQIQQAEQKHAGSVTAINKARNEKFSPLKAADLGYSATPSPARSAPPLPATLSSSDVGKVYQSPKTGKLMKITAVNPQNPKQFRSEEQ